MGARVVALFAVFAFAASLVLASGCGGGGDSGSTPSVATTATVPTVSKAEFVRKANAACRHERADLRRQVALYERRRDGRTPTQYADMVHFVYLPTVEREIRGIESSGRPAGEKELLRVILAADRTAIDSVAVMPRVASIAVAKQHFTRANRLLRAYGLSACAQDG